MLRTNTDLDSAEVALQYKRLWTVEHWFRSCKSLLQTRPIYHKCDETIRGHVFCSFLALVLRQELQARLEERGHELEWADVIGDLDRLQMVEVEQDGKRFLLRSEVQGTCGKVFQTVGVAVPPTVQQARRSPQGRTLRLVPRRRVDASSPCHYWRCYIVVLKMSIREHSIWCSLRVASRGR